MESLDLSVALMKKYPLIYEISNCFYYIGMGVFQKCDEKEVETYTKMKTELRRLSLISTAFSELTESDVQDLTALYNVILQKYKNLPVDGERNETNKEITMFICNLTNVEKESLTSQITEYITITDLADGCFYRESEVYKNGKEIKQ